MNKFLDGLKLKMRSLYSLKVEALVLAFGAALAIAWVYALWDSGASSREKTWARVAQFSSVFTEEKLREIVRDPVAAAEFDFVLAGVCGQFSKPTDAVDCNAMKYAGIDKLWQRVRVDAYMERLTAARSDKNR